MGGRYTLESRAEIIAETFGVQVPPTLPERFNIAPSQPVLAVREKPGSRERELVALHWGPVPFWADDPEIGNRMANARCESAATKPAFRSSFRARRCLIVADGFYEWRAREGKKQPYYIPLPRGSTTRRTATTNYRSGRSRLPADRRQGANQPGFQRSINQVGATIED